MTTTHDGVVRVVTCDGWDADTFDKCASSFKSDVASESIIRADGGWRHDDWFNKDYCGKHDFKGALA